MAPSSLAEQSFKEKVAVHLSQTLADTYVLYAKTQNFHWNVEDSRFYSLHKMFEKQYNELAEAIDEIAERLRALNVKSPGSLKQFLELTQLEESEDPFNANEMIQQLIEDHASIANRLRRWIPETQKHGDEGTADLFIDRLKYHEKISWMLRSHFINEEKS